MSRLIRHPGLADWRSHRSIRVSGLISPYRRGCGFETSRPTSTPHAEIRIEHRVPSPLTQRHGDPFVRAALRCCDMPGNSGPSLVFA